MDMVRMGYFAKPQRELGLNNGILYVRAVREVQ